MTESSMNFSEDASTADTSTPPKKSGGCGKTLLIVGGIGLFTMLLCCGVGGWFAWSVMPKVATNPAEVTAISKEILEMDIPKEFRPESAISMNNFAMTMKMATYKYNAGNLTIGTFRMKVGDQRQKPDFQQSTNQAMNLQMGNTVVHELTVRGEKVPFRFSEAVDTDSKKDYHVVEGELTSAGTTTFLKLVLEEGDFNENEVVKMIESIR
ncbi:MAG: hypothetical protein JSS49_19945 [Planctomycetes bacterium]|nr:hypothetical protein [Planctomycetota bacterium]